MSRVSSSFIASLTALIVLSVGLRTASAIGFTWIAGSGDWQVPQFWAPFVPPIMGPPGLGDAASIGGNVDVTLQANVQGLTGMLLQAQADVFTNGNQLTVADVAGGATATIAGTGAAGNNTELFVEPVGGATPGFIGDSLNLVLGGELDLVGGGITRITNKLSVDEASIITGDGTIAFSNTHGVSGRRLDLHGTIRPDFNDTIRLVVQGGTVDLDGEGVTGSGLGVIELSSTGSALEVEGSLSDAFSGRIEMAADTSLSISEPWTFAQGTGGAPVLEVAAGTGSATISGGEVTVGSANATVDVVSGFLQVDADSRFQSSANINLGDSGSLQIGGHSSIITGGSWTGTGAVNLDASLTTIAANTTVNMPNGTFDIDGNFAGHTVAIDQILLLNVASVDDNDNSRIDGTTQINGTTGQLNVQFTNPSKSYEFQGNLELNGPGGGFVGTHLAGADVELSGATSVTGNSRSQARVELSGAMDIAANGSFNLAGGSSADPNVVRSTASFSGGGRLVVSSVAQLNVEDGATIGVDVDNRGRFESGLSLGSVVVNGAYEQTAGGVLGFEIAGSPGIDQDLLQVTNVASIDGELDVTLLAGFAPSPGDVYTVITAGAVLGSFDALNTAGAGIVDFDATLSYPFGRVLLNITDVTIAGDFNEDLGLDCADVDALVAEIAIGGADLSFDLTGDGLVTTADLDQWLADSGTFNVGGAYLPGDANLDGNVDGTDFLIWSANKFNDAPGWCAGDFTADGNIDGADFLVWNAFKFMSSDTAMASVPEPTAGTLALLALMTLIRRRRG